MVKFFFEKLQTLDKASYMYKSANIMLDYIDRQIALFLGVHCLENTVLSRLLTVTTHYCIDSIMHYENSKT